MNFATKNHIALTLGFALLASSALSASAFAAEPTLAHNESAAQDAIVSANDSRNAGTVESTTPTLAHNEDAAQRVIADASTPARHRDDTIGKATLTQNEIAARRAIADVANTTARVEQADATLASAASTTSAPSR